MEQDRLDLQHHVITLLLNGELHLAPLESPKRILDLGTGTGLWAIEMADSFPNATVIGTDLSPVQPTMYDLHSDLCHRGFVPWVDTEICLGFLTMFALK